MKVKRLIILIVIMFAVCPGCDNMFEDWLDDSPATGTGELQWMSLGTYNETLGMTTLSSEYTGSASPRLVVYNGALYALWVQDNTLINLYRYNGNDFSPWWTFEDSFSYASLTGELAVCSVGGAMYIGFVDGADLNVLDQNGTQIGTNIDYNTGGNPGSLNLVAYDNNLFVVWEESSQVRMKKYAIGTATWEAGVEDNYGINDLSNITAKGRAVAGGGLLHVLFVEDSYYVKMRHYDDASITWSTYHSGMNYDMVNPGSPDYPSITTYYGQPYAMWREMLGTGEYRLNACINNGYESLMRLDGAGLGGIRWDDGNLYKDVKDTNFVVAGGNLYALWVENVYDYEMGMTFDSFRVAEYDPFAYNAGRPWHYVDGNDYQGLNVNHSFNATSPYGVDYNGKIYVIFLEEYGGYNYVHVKVVH